MFRRGRGYKTRTMIRLTILDFACSAEVQGLVGRCQLARDPSVLVHKFFFLFS